MNNKEIEKILIDKGVTIIREDNSTMFYFKEDTYFVIFKDSISFCNKNENPKMIPFKNFIESRKRVYITKANEEANEDLCFEIRESDLMPQCFHLTLSKEYELENPYISNKTKKTEILGLFLINFIIEEHMRFKNDEVNFN